MTLPSLRDLAMLARLTRDFPGFIRTPITSEQAVEIIRGRLAAREERFLRMAERAIFGHERSPYHQLLRAAGCEFGDLKALVDKEGLEVALSRLVEAGVFVTFDEFKGRKEATRGTRRFVFAEDDFDNPHLSPHFEARSGGTRGPSTSVKRGLPSILSDDLHLFSDCDALIQRSREVTDSGLSVGAFLFTSLLPSAPKILLNVESGDYGTVWRRDCGCQLGALGLTTHLAKIRSFEKLTGEGMTFVQTDLLRLLEKILPSHFGGTSADYQLLEEEGADGILRLLLVVSPRIGPVDGDAIQSLFVDELGRDGGFTRAYAEVWRRAGTVQVKRQWPVATKAGKILPFHVIKR